MAEGKWYLVYTWLNTFEPRGGKYEDKEIPLNVVTKTGAILEGRKKWAEVLVEANSRWEEQKDICAYAPSTAFGGARPNPRIIYKIFL